MKNLRIGFIGLGEMGKPMAKNLLKNRFELTTCGHIRKGPVEELRSLGATVAHSPKEVAESSDVIIVMVRDIPQTDEVVLGEGFWKGRGIWQGIQSDSTLVLCSTLLPSYCQKLAEKGKESRIFVLDSPVSGGYLKAEAGTLTFMVGGDREAFNECRPIFDAMGKIIYYLGGPGMGQVIKLVNNYMMIVTSYGASEGIIMGLKAGLGLEQILKIIKVSSGNSAVIEQWNLMAKHQKEYGDNKPGTMSLFSKDIALAVDFAKEIGVKADFGRLVLESDESYLFPTDSPI